MEIKALGQIETVSIKLQEAAGVMALEGTEDQP